MILLDTNVLIYAFDTDSPFFQWARDTISAGVGGDGAAINAVSLAEIWVGDSHPATVADRIRSWGVDVLDVPSAVAVVCAKAYLRYQERRMTHSGPVLPSMPLPDFFIGAHAQIMGWDLATADKGRFQSYFPSVTLRMPE